MSAKGNAPNRRVAAIQAKKKRKQPKKSKTVGEGGQDKGKERDRPARETRQEQEQSRSFEEVGFNSPCSVSSAACNSSTCSNSFNVEQKQYELQKKGKTSFTKVRNLVVGALLYRCATGKWATPMLEPLMGEIEWVHLKNRKWEIRVKHHNMGAFVGVVTLKMQRGGLVPLPG